jgi:hypothetical protein
MPSIGTKPVRPVGPNAPEITAVIGTPSTARHNKLQRIQLFARNLPTDTDVSDWDWSYEYVTTTVFFDLDGVLTTDGSGSYTTCRNIGRTLPEVSLERILECYRHNSAEGELPTGGDHGQQQREV